MKYIELSEYSGSQSCKFDRIHTPTKFYETPIFPGIYTGVYYQADKAFFALYPSPDGPMIFFEGKNYPLHEDLDISFIRNGDMRRFEIRNYGISIGEYKKSNMIGWDWWAAEELDVDLFCRIEKEYKTDLFYEQDTKDFIFLD